MNHHSIRVSCGPGMQVTRFCHMSSKDTSWMQISSHLFREVTRWQQGQCEYMLKIIPLEFALWKPRMLLSLRIYSSAQQWHKAAPGNELPTTLMYQTPHSHQQFRKQQLGKYRSIFYRKSTWHNCRASITPDLDRRSLLYCVPGDWRNVLNLFIFQIFDLPEGRIWLHRKEQGRSAWGSAHPALLCEQQHKQLPHTQFQGTAPETLPVILATGFLVWLFLFTDLLQHSSPVPGGLKTFWRWSIWVLHHKTLVCGTQPPWCEISSWTHCAEPPGWASSFQKPLKLPRSLSHCSGVSLHQLSLKLSPSCTCESTWTGPPTLDQKKITTGHGDLHFSCFHVKKMNHW